MLLLVAVCAWIAPAIALTSPYCALPCNNRPHTVCEHQNTKCGPGPKCGPDFHEVQLTAELRQHVLDLHNEFRNRVAGGKEARGGHQPPASNMLTMSYDRELEVIAQCWANRCNGNPLVHDVCRSTKRHEHVGQNLGFLNSTHESASVKDALRKLITSWYDEVAQFRREWVAATKDRGPQVKVGHYTQMLWADTEAVGCALAAYTTPNTRATQTQPPPIRRSHPLHGEVIVLPPKVNRKWHHLLLVCNYGPGGNYLGAPLYAQGAPCSQCPPGRGCSSYASLCGRRTNV